MLVLIGTLVTAVSSFYFGSKAPSAAAVPAADGTRAAAPIVRSITPPAALTRGSNETQIEIAGDNLNNIMEARASFDANQVLASDVVSNANVVRCKFKIEASMPAGQWDIVVADVVGRQAKLPAALTVT